MKVPRTLHATTLLALFLVFGLPGRDADMSHAAENRSDLLDIHTVLPFDAIPAIFEPEFVDAGEADVRGDSPMIGVSLNGEQHAYSMVLLNHHEIVNDRVGGEPIATTW